MRLERDIFYVSIGYCYLIQYRYLFHKDIYGDDVLTIVGIFPDNLTLAFPEVRLGVKAIRYFRMSR